MENMKWKLIIIAAAVCLLFGSFFMSGNSKPGLKTPKDDNKIAALSEAAKTETKTTENANKDITDSEQAAGEKTEKQSPTITPSEKQANESKPEKTEKATAGKSSKKDKYLTDPVPEGKPKPVEWQDAVVDKNQKLTCTLSVTCKTILDNMDKFNTDKLEVLPKDGVIYKTKKVTFYEGESVFDVLLREMKNNKIHMEFEMTPIYNSNYIEGIHNLYEFDCGELSGWMYRVNGWYPNYGCSRYKLKDKDVIEWIYTCDLGRDIGGGYATGGKK